MDENWDKINAVQRMQDYIMAHYQEDISLQDLAEAASYSPWHALRAFSELVGKTPFAYLRAVRLSEAAKKLRDSGASVLDIALSSAFGSHEGFSKAFSREFAISPSKYRKRTPPIRLFSTTLSAIITKHLREEKRLCPALLFLRRSLSGRHGSSY